MKRLFTLFLVIIAMVFFGAGVCSAADTVNILATAFVPNESPDITVTILRFTDGNPDNNPWTNSVDVTTTGTMNFGTLTYELTDGSNAGGWYSQAGFCVVIYATPFGSPYEVKSTCLGLTSGASFLPIGSFGLTPVYSPNDEWVYPGGSTTQGDMPSGATLGTAGSAIAINKIVYSSESGTATPRIIQAYYGLPPYKTGGVDPFPGYEQIPLDQPHGTYSGTVTITISPK